MNCWKIESGLPWNCGKLTIRYACRKGNDIMATSSFTRNIAISNKEEAKRFCDIISSKYSATVKLEKVESKRVSGQDLLKMLKKGK